MLADGIAGRGRVPGRPLWLYALVLLIGMLPLLWPAIPPFTDLPAHMARAHIALNLEHSAALQRYYGYEWHWIGNLGSDLLIFGLGALTGAEAAMKIVVIATVLGTMAGMLWVSRELHGSVQPTAIIALLLGYNYPLTFGFVNYCLAMALVLCAFALWLRLTCQKRIRLRSALFVPIAVIITVCHIVGYGALGVLCFMSELARHRDLDLSWREAILKSVVACLPLAVPIFPMLLWISDGSGSGVMASGWFKFGTKLKWLLFLQRDRWIVVDILCGLALLGIAGCALARRFGLSIDRRLGWGALALLVVGMLFPAKTMMGSAYGGERLLPYAVAILLLATRCAAGGVQWRRWMLVASALFVLRMGVLTASTYAYDREYRTNLTALDHIERGSAVAMMVGKSCSGGVADWFVSRLGHVGSVATVRKDVFTNDQFATKGAHLLQIRYAEAGAFQRDPSHQVASDDCEKLGRTDGPPPAQKLIEQLPRRAFQYVWVMSVPQQFQPSAPWLLPIWRTQDGVLFRIEQTPGA